MLFSSALGRLRHCLSLVAQSEHLFVLQLVHLLRQVEFLTPNEQLLLQLANLLAHVGDLGILVQDLSLCVAIDLHDLLIG